MSIADELKMDHLPIPDVDLETLQQETEEALPTTSDDAPEKPDPRDNEKYPFEFDYTSPRGKRYSGRFVNQILDISKRQKKGILAAKLAGSMPQMSLDEDTIILCASLAHMSYSLIERPKWAESLQKLLDVDVILALWARVLNHENHFFRISPPEEAGSGLSEGETET